MHKVSIDVGLVELDKFKKEDKEAIGPKEKVSVPYLCLNNLPESVLSILLQSDRDGTYHRHDYQKNDSYEVLWAGDMGANSTKFGFFNTREQKFNSGQKLRICCMLNKHQTQMKIFPKFLLLQLSQYWKV